MENQQKKFLNALNIIFSSNQEAIFKLVKKYSLPEKIFNLAKSDLINLGFKNETIENFLKKRNKIDIEKEWEKLEKESIKVIAQDEKEYPPLLKEIAKPPILLYIKGNLLPNEKYFSCIGTRWPSDYGKMVT